jgi:dipeptidyl aminopeptidase/acylaminoacyl peptidase/CubicO group peptidase (beta-lactamase class C family)
MSKRSSRDVRRFLTADDIWALAVPSQPSLAPNGRQVAYVLTTADREADAFRSSIWTVATSGGSPRRLTSGQADSSPVWSPDGKWLAFLRAGEGGPPQLYVLPSGSAGGGEARRLTDLPLGAGKPVWSPDSKRIAFAATVDMSARDADPHTPVSIDRLGFKADGAGLIRSLRRHLFVVEAAGEDPRARQVTFGDRSSSTPVWSPDGAALAYSASVGPDADLSPNLVVHTVPAGGGVPHAITNEQGLFQVTDWSPDAATLLLVGRPGMRPGHDRLYLVSASGGEPVELAPGYDRNVMAGAPGYPGTPPRFEGEGDGVLFCARERGAVHLMRVSAASGEPETVAGGDRVVAGASASGGRIGFVAATASSPGEIWVTGDRGERCLTDHFNTALPDVRLFHPEEVEFSAPDGMPLHGWIIRGESSGAEAGEPTPLLLDVHGGPHNAWGPAFDGIHAYHQLLAGAGWTVLIINPRGSDGYGEDFYTAVCGGWGERDEGDFLAAIDSMVERRLADPDRIAVSGYSYGGYMTCWLTSRHKWFKAAVAGGCVSDLVSLAGTSDLGRHLAEVEIGVTPPKGNQVLARLSPLTKAGAVATPTLLLHGENDHRCPVGQAEQWFTALRSNRVPVELVRYPGAGHLFILDGKPSHRVDFSERIADWVRLHAHEQDPGRTVRARASAGDLQSRLEELVARHNVPGASLAVFAGGEVLTAAAGVLNLATGTAVTADSVFQIGSISKVYTATAVMQLVEDGRLDLDAPVVEVLPELELGDPDVAKTVTMRHLLTHTSGIQGEHFVDTGRGDDCVARYVAACAELGQSHPLGATMSYCNTGYVIAGRVIEVLTGKTWDEALKDRIFEPLGLSRTMTLPEEVLRFAGAVGHVPGAGGDPEVAPVWCLPRSAGPAGLICSTASEVLDFARMHMDGGLARDGSRLLSEQSVAGMQEPQVAVPDPYTLGSHWGLGWILFDWNGRRLYGHDGNTIGQSGFLRVVPDAGVAVALLANGGNTQDLYRELYGSLLRELAGVEMAARPEPPAEPIESHTDLDQYTGVYERVGVTMKATVEKGRLVLTTTSTGPLASLLPDPTTRHELVAVDDGLFVTRQPGMQTWTPVVFYRLPDGTPYVHMGARATPRVS